jgi:hypothetical protein
LTTYHSPLRSFSRSSVRAKTRRAIVRKMSGPKNTSFADRLSAAANAKRFSWNGRLERGLRPRAVPLSSRERHGRRSGWLATPVSLSEQFSPLITQFFAPSTRRDRPRSISPGGPEQGYNIASFEGRAVGVKTSAISGMSGSEKVSPIAAGPPIAPPAKGRSDRRTLPAARYPYLLGTVLRLP